MRRRDILLRSLTTGLAKVVAAATAFFMTLLITRNLNSSESGSVLLAITILTVGSTIFRFGLDNVILRKVSSDFAEVRGRGVVLSGIFWIAAISIPFSIFTSLNSNFLAINVFNNQDFSDILKISILALPAISSFMLLSKGFQGLQKVTTSVFFLNLGISLFFIIFFTFCLYAINVRLNAPETMTIYVVSAYIVLGIGLLLWNRYCRGDWGKVDIYSRELLVSSSNLWLASLSVLAVQWSSLLVAGAFVESSEFAVLSAAQRTASLVSFILMIVNMVVAPRFAILWKASNFSGLTSLAKWSARGCILISTPVVLVILINSDEIMELFGNSYSRGAIYLSILAFGQYINVVTGSVGYLLTMSGHERDYRKVTIIVGPLTIILSYFLISNYGALGAAISTTIGLCIQNISALFVVRHRLGFFPIG